MSVLILLPALTPWTFYFCPFPNSNKTKRYTTKSPNKHQLAWRSGFRGWGLTACLRSQGLGGGLPSCLVPGRNQETQTAQGTRSPARKHAAVLTSWVEG